MFPRTQAQGSAPGTLGVLIVFLLPIPQVASFSPPQMEGTGVDPDATLERDAPSPMTAGQMAKLILFFLPSLQVGTFSPPT